MNAAAVALKSKAANKQTHLLNINQKQSETKQTRQNVNKKGGGLSAKFFGGGTAAFSAEKALQACSAGFCRGPGVHGLLCGILGWALNRDARTLGDSCRM